ncbi:PDDEXK nuclease domain-containing protein [Actinomycetaceae bacterium MB13-C1-2]|nr:PDDEXK nuclease domain-containing protein [Actinomycetaceae bacterium MB13-C1-2]
MTKNPGEVEIGAAVWHQSGDAVSPFRAIAESVSAKGGDLVDRVSALIDQAQSFAAAQVNATLTLRNWYIGRMIDVEVLREERAGYEQEIVATLARQLTNEYGRSYSRANLYRMMQFAREFPEADIVATLSRQLSWSHFHVLLPVRTDEARSFYIKQAVTAHLSVRALRELIGRQGFERKEIANVQTRGGVVVPADSFRDPYLLDFLGLKDAFAEKDLEEAILRDVESFLLEVGNGWAFVERQKRMTIDNDDFHLDLLFYSRPLRRLIAIELKVGRFKAAFEGQMKLYLKWLDRYERLDDEEPPIGLILCTETSREQIELLEMHKDGIVVAEYWTALPPKAELQARIQKIYQEAQERVARRQLAATDDDDE